MSDDPFKSFFPDFTSFFKDLKESGLFKEVRWTTTKTSSTSSSGDAKRMLKNINPDKFYGISTTPEGRVRFQVGPDGDSILVNLPADAAHKLAERLDRAANLADLASRTSAKAKTP